MKICTVDYCENKSITRGYCVKHYRRWMRHGDPNVITCPRGQVRAYFENYVLSYEGDDCLIWPFSRTTSGYGAITYGRKRNIVSRLICKRIHGEPDDPSLEAAHSCGNGHLGCVSKRHLSWKTREENQADRFIHGTENRGSKTGAAKLKEDDVLKITSLLPLKKQSEIAVLFGVAPSAISAIANGENWGWLTARRRSAPSHRASNKG